MCVWCCFLIYRSLLLKSAFTVDGLRLHTPLVVFQEIFSGVGLQIDMEGGCPFPVVSLVLLLQSIFSDWQKTSGQLSLAEPFGDS